MKTKRNEGFTIIELLVCLMFLVGIGIFLGVLATGAHIVMKFL